MKKIYLKKFILFLGSMLIGLSSALAQPCADKKVLIEMACAKGCAPCLFKIEELREFYESNQEDICLVVYNQAPIGVGSWGESDQPYNGFHDEFNLDYQSSRMVDRTFMPSNYSTSEGDDSEAIDDLTTAFDQQIALDYVPVSINIAPSYNNDTREVVVELEAEFCDTASGDLRIYLVLVQDTTIGPAGAEYGQNCSESWADELGYNTENGYELVGGDGGSLWISQFPFYQTVKVQPSGFYGNEGVIDESVDFGDSFSETYTFILPEFGDETSIVPLTPQSVEILAAVVKKGSFGNREVLNANKTRLLSEEELGIEEFKGSEFGFKLQSNIIQGTENMIITPFGIKGQKHDLVLYNAAGEQISILQKNWIFTDEVSESFIMDYPNGIYFLSLRNSAGKQFTQKIILN